jgi:hypothetical protein
MQGCVCRKSLHHAVGGGVYVEVVVGYVLFGEVDRAVVGRFPRACSFIACTAFFQHKNQLTQLIP